MFQGRGIVSPGFKSRIRHLWQALRVPGDVESFADSAKEEEEEHDVRDVSGRAAERFARVSGLECCDSYKFDTEHTVGEKWHYKAVIESTAVLHRFPGFSYNTAEG